MTRSSRRTRSAPASGPTPPQAAPRLSPPASDLETITAIIHDLAAKQQRISAYIDASWESDALPLDELARLMALHAQNASRLARLLRDKRALSGQAADGIAGAIAQALDELATEWGVQL